MTLSEIINTAIDTQNSALAFKASDIMRFYMGFNYSRSIEYVESKSDNPEAGIIWDQLLTR